MQTKNYDVSGAFNDNKKAYNIFKEKHDVESCFGWSKIVTQEQSDQLKDTNIGVFMVNLTKGAMMGPHWNQNHAEIAIGLHGRGMTTVVCPTIPNETLCKNQRFKVEEGDVFVVPRYHPMSQMSYNNGSFVFVGFTLTSKKNSPRYLAGKPSILRILDKLVLAKSLDASKMVIDQIYSDKSEALLFECTSCAEEEERLMEEEVMREREGRGEGRHRKEREGATGGKGREEKETEREGEGGGRWGKQEKGREEGEMARKEEEEMGRKQREAEETTTRGRGGPGWGRVQ